MPTKIFFSWQIDRAPLTGRNFIERALERAAGSISRDTTVEEAMRDQIEIDRDTKGVPGSPPIVDTIFKKIDESTVFVPDLTFVGTRPDGRPTPNPNVLIEYGWALKSLTHARIVPVMNTAYGEPTEANMPFDMRHLRHPLCYHCDETADEETRKKSRDELAKKLEEYIKAVLKIGPTVTRKEPFVETEAKEGAGRFRLPGEALGVSEGHLLRAGQPIRLSNGPAVWFRLMPTVDPGRQWGVTELKRAATDASSFLRPIGNGWSGLNYLRNIDGFGMYATYRPENETPSVVFAFTSGEVWAVDTYIISALDRDGSKIIPPYEGELRSSLINYGDFLFRLGIKPPYRWVAGMENLHGRGIINPAGKMAGYRGALGTCLQDTIICDGPYSPGDPPGKALSPFFTRLFDSCGVERPAGLDE